MDKFEKYLKDKYIDKEFTFEELLEKLPYSKHKLYDKLNELIKTNKIVKIAEGVYTLRKSEIIKTPEDISNLSDKLKTRITRKFKFTGLCVLLPLVHHTPYSITYLIYVEKGSGEDFKELISIIKPNMPILLNPKINEILLILNETNKNVILTIRENNYFYGKEYGISYLDTAFVDLYFEVSRDKIPFMKSDLKEILKELILKDSVNYSRLMRYAHERKLTHEIKDMLLELSKIIEVPKAGLNVLQKIS
ncbi:MAG: hypothetical protein GQ477_04750 [Nanohaloarchaea archaeon]|nr:hypothetical protein [Candidatus Nanohaloarchaea archaeon]